MARSRKLAGLFASAALVLAAAPAWAQDESPSAPADMGDMAGPTIEVTGVDYAFVGLPTTVPAGTTLTFKDEGTEVHEMAVIHILDETTPLEELMAMPEEESASLIEFVGFLSAIPGTSAEGSVALQTPGRYVALCFIPQGMTMDALEAAGVDPAAMGPDTDPSEMPPEAQEFFASLESNPPHMALGMIQEFTVTEAGTEVGPLPSQAAEETAAEPEASPSE
jgi:plastocyanin